VSKETFERFRLLVFDDESLQRELSELSEHDLFVAQVVKLARDRGLSVHEADVEEALSDARREWLERWI
jgi:hypothetical protein